MMLALLSVFATMDEAALDGLRQASRCPPTVECGGVVYATPAGYVVSVIASGSAYGIDLGPLYNRYTVADFHTHICGRHNREFANFFSPADVLVNQGLHTVGYMLSLCDHNVRRYDPMQDVDGDEEVDFRSGKVLYLTNGHITGWIKT